MGNRTAPFCGLVTMLCIASCFFLNGLHCVLLPRSHLPAHDFYGSDVEAYAREQTAALVELYSTGCDEETTGYHKRRFIANIKDALKKGGVLIFQDESWIDVRGRLGKAWMPRQFASFKEAAKFTYQHESNPSSPRIIILAAADKDGIMPETVVVYKVKKSKKASADYHDNVSTRTFLRWFKDACATAKKKYPNQPIYFVVDNAPYHSTSRAPLLNSRKEVLQDFLIKEQDKLAGRLGDDPENYIRSLHLPRLRSYIRELKKEYKYYIMEDVAKENGVNIIRLPPWNCELNPIEYAWKDIKHEVKKRNANLNIDDLVQLTEQVAMNYGNTSNWRKHMEHCDKLRDKYDAEERISDIIPKGLPTPIIIPLGESSSEEDVDESSDESGEEIPGEDILAEEDSDYEMPLLNPNTYDQSADPMSEDEMPDMPILDYYGDLISMPTELPMKTNYDLFHDQYNPDDEIINARMDPIDEEDDELRRPLDGTDDGEPRPKIPRVDLFGQQNNRDELNEEHGNSGEEVDDELD